MKLIQSVLPLLSIFNLDTGRETTVETRPALADWLPAGGDLVPAPGQQIERVIERVKRDGNVTIFEREIIFIRHEAPVTTPEPQPERPYEFVTEYGPPLSIGKTAQIVADWHAGRARWIGGPPDPDQALRDAFAPQQRTQMQPARIANGRIVLSE